MLEHKENGFTLIELMTVLAIIGVLASILVVQMNSARAKARDSRRIAELRQMQSALYLFYDSAGRMPRNYNCNSGTIGEPKIPCDYDSNPNLSPGLGACDKEVPGVIGADPNIPLPPPYDPTQMVHLPAFNATMQEMIDEGVLPQNFESPPGGGYCYLDTGPSGGVMLVTALEEAQPTTTGIPPSCRPNPAGQFNWCTQDSSKQYCLCTPY